MRACLRVYVRVGKRVDQSVVKGHRRPPPPTVTRHEASNLSLMYTGCVFTSGDVDLIHTQPSSFHLTLTMMEESIGGIQLPAPVDYLTFGIHLN